jgi:hypothetical protein
MSGNWCHGCQYSLLSPKLESTEYQLLETSEDIESLDEIMRKQNVRKGLTNISDKCFNFFLLLDKKIRLLETTANIDIHGTNFHSFVISQLQKDESLLTCEVRNKFYGHSIS